MKLLTGVSALIAVSVCLAAPSYWPRDEDRPSFCRGLQCPAYEVISKTKDYELRKYRPSVWVSTDVEIGEAYWETSSGRSQALSKLRDYMQGENDRKQKMAMTTPVVTKHSKDQVTMYLLLPAEFASNPPQPTGDGVRIYQSPGGQFYVTSFGGYGNMLGFNRYKSFVNSLKQRLDADGQSYDGNMFKTASYDSLTRMLGRHNEVAFQKQ